MERTYILPLTNKLYLTNLNNLSKALIIISNKESPPSYYITFTSILIPGTGFSGHFVMTNYVMSIAPGHDMQPDIPGIDVTLTYEKLYPRTL